MTLHKMFNLTIYTIKLYLINYIPKDNSFPFSFLPLRENFYTFKRNRFFSSACQSHRLRVADTIRDAELLSYDYYSPMRSDYFRYSRGNDNAVNIDAAVRSFAVYFHHAGRYERTRTHRDLRTSLWSWQSPRRAGSDTARLYSLRPAKTTLYGDGIVTQSPQLRDAFAGMRRIFIGCQRSFYDRLNGIESLCFCIRFLFAVVDDGRYLIINNYSLPHAIKSEKESQA